MKKLLFILFMFSAFTVYSQSKVEKWGVFEMAFKGTDKGNPFTEIQFNIEFSNGTHKKTVQGFYDGAGIYKVRFMPDITGTWTYITKSNSKLLDNKKGKFECTPPSANNHGPFVVNDTFYFAYADGKPHYSFGTTCYGWAHQGDSLAELTLQTLSNGYFNKMRMCIFPKDYDWNKNEPLLYPFEGKPLKSWDFTRFNPAYFRNIEKRISQLDSLGIEADLIVFHPYDRWGFSGMDKKTDEFYINYIIARFAAYKNVWWSMANEYDLMREKKIEDWDNYIRLFAETDPYNRLRGIHNAGTWYDHSNPLITHASIQNEDTYRAKEFRKKYNKPVVYDEIRYEGNIHWSWGNLTPQELTNKFWRGVTNGGFVGHGETYVTENPIVWPNESHSVLWWSKGGVLKGKSHERIKFLKQIIEDSPGNLQPVSLFPWWMPFSAIAYKDEYILTYFNMDQPHFQIIELPEKANYKADIIDTWNMTITPVPARTLTGKVLIELPGTPGIAIRFIKL